MAPVGLCPQLLEHTDPGSREGSRFDLLTSTHLLSVLTIFSSAVAEVLMPTGLALPLQGEPLQLPHGFLKWKWGLPPGHGLLVHITHLANKGLPLLIDKLHPVYWEVFVMGRASV